MPGKEIIAKRITKGLECCDFEYPPCRHCPYQICGLRECKKILIKDAYYLVKTQQKEIEQKNKQIEELVDFQRFCKKKAIKEFAEKLKKLPVPYHSDIDNLVKEMVGADNEKF